MPIMALAQPYPFQDEALPRHERVMDLLGRLTLEEKSDLMQATSHGVPRLGIPKYFHGNEALHGVVRPGRFTVFPQAIGLAASWDPDLSPSSPKPLPSVLHGIPNSSNVWQQPSAMRLVVDGTNWAKDACRTASSAIFSPSGAQRSTWRVTLDGGALPRPMARILT